MATIKLVQDFKEFLKLLNSKTVKYLLVGGYAVSYYGYPRSTGDMDIWIEVSEENAMKTVESLIEFGMAEEDVTKELFMKSGQIIRMGVPPVRIEVLTGVSGVTFNDCYARREVIDVDGISIDIISIDDLKANKQAAGRNKDLEDLKHL